MRDEITLSLSDPKARVALEVYTHLCEDRGFALALRTKLRAAEEGQSGERIVG